jgi:hypothetical protein
VHCSPRNDLSNLQGRPCTELSPYNSCIDSTAKPRVAKQSKSAVKVLHTQLSGSNIQAAISVNQSLWKFHLLDVARTSCGRAQPFWQISRIMLTTATKN